jgi:HlyD family secretion protein
VKKLIFLLLLLGGALAGGAYWISQRGNGASGAGSYTLAPVEFGKLTETVSATGVVQPLRAYQVGSELSGRVVEVAADFNQEVEEGAVLLRLDDQTARKQRDQARTAVEAARISVRQAEAQRDTARKMLEREQERSPELRREIEVQVLSNQLRAAEAAVAGSRIKVTQAEESLELAELALSKTVIRAPVLKGAEKAPGVGRLVEDSTSPSSRHRFLVLDRKVSLGQMIAPPLSAHLFTLAGDLGTVQIEAQVAEGDISKVSRGLTADFTVASYSEVELHFQGKVTDVRLLPVNDRGAIFYKVILEAPNERDSATGRWRLTPGLTATVDIVRNQHERAWKMPVMALSFQPDETKLSEGAREALRKGQDRKDQEQWRPVWVLGEDRTPWPLFVRIGGTNKAGDTGIRDLSFVEVLEWPADRAVKPEAGRPETYPQVIIAAPPGKAGLFNPPSIKF